MKVEKMPPARNALRDISEVGFLCTGCAACATVCVKRCITMTPNEEGFLFPRINRQICIACGKCLMICPAFSGFQEKTPTAVYAAASKEIEETWNSSSGGVFFYAAKYVIEELKGYVCGAVLDDKLMLQHIVTNDLHIVSKMQGSKYIQSDIGNSYIQIIDLVKKGETVLFSGTPCQVAGIISATNNSEHLYTMDLICHGVPSNLAFQDYMHSMYELNLPMQLTFRQKSRHIKSSFSYSYYKNGNMTKSKTIPAFKDPFYQAFLDGYNYRESCYSCQYTKSKRVGDMTIGDCANWKAYEFSVDKVLSTVIINSEKGAALWAAIANKFDFKDADYPKECEMNMQLHTCVSRAPKRDKFYKDIKMFSLQQLKAKYCPHRGVKEKLVYFVLTHTTANGRNTLKRLLRRNK